MKAQTTSSFLYTEQKMARDRFLGVIVLLFGIAQIAASLDLFSQLYLTDSEGVNALLLDFGWLLAISQCLNIKEPLAEAILKPLFAFDLALHFHLNQNLLSIGNGGGLVGVQFAFVFLLGTCLISLPAELKTDFGRTEVGFDLIHWLKARAAVYGVDFVITSVMYTSAVEVFATGTSWWWILISIIFAAGNLAAQITTWRMSIWSEKLEKVEAPDYMAALIGKSGVKNVQLVIYDFNHVCALSDGWARSLCSSTVIGLRRDFLSSSKEKIEFMLCHELGHAKFQHSLKQFAIDAFIRMAALGSFALVLNSTVEGGWKTLTYLELLSLLVVVCHLSMRLTTSIERSISRAFERQADEYAVHLLGSAAPMIEFFADRIMQEPTHTNDTAVASIDWLPTFMRPAISFMHGRSHPTDQERLATAKTLLASLDPSSEITRLASNGLEPEVIA